MSIEAMKQALEALEDTLSGDLTPYQAAKAITALRQAIAELEKQEPVAWMSPSWIDPDTRGWQSDSFESIPIEGWLPVYISPPQRQPLTDEQLQQVMDAEEVNGNIAVAFARAIEAAHGITGEKNG